MAFHSTKAEITLWSFIQQVKVTMAVIINENAATTRLAWLTSNISASQLFTTSHESHAVYQPQS